MKYFQCWNLFRKGVFIFHLVHTLFIKKGKKTSMLSKHLSLFVKLNQLVSMVPPSDFQYCNTSKCSLHCWKHSYCDTFACFVSHLLK